MQLDRNKNPNAETRIRYLADPEVIVKEKRYKLGEWLHQEYRGKFKKTARLLENAGLPNG